MISHSICFHLFPLGAKYFFVAEIAYDQIWANLRLFVATATGQTLPFIAAFAAFLALCVKFGEKA